jgi:hypothetical protein
MIQYLNHNTLQPKALKCICCFFIVPFFFQCAPEKAEEKEANSMLNTSHLDALYEEKKVGEDTVGIIHIYAEYPDYKWVGDDDEGVACVDDASRAAIFYLRQHAVTSDPEHLRKGRMLIKFLLAMQAPNGYYYNFIWPDGTIHKDGITSKPEPNFWSWRVLWAFGESIDLLERNDPLVSKIKQQRNGLVSQMLKQESFKTSRTDTSMGWTFPAWLPKISGTDQAAIVIIGLSHMAKQASTDEVIPKDTILAFIDHFAEGIMIMQVEQPDSLYDGAFLSWENLWHAYANIQAYALLIAGEISGDPHMTSHALYEIDHFYPAMLASGGMNHFMVNIKDGKISLYDSSLFPQIAYGRRPMIWAAVKAYEITKDEKYLSLAKALAKWFSGDNAANVPMYDAATGRGYDAINSPEQINKNAGAESTIEALLSLQVLEK